VSMTEIPSQTYILKHINHSYSIIVAMCSNKQGCPNQSRTTSIRLQMQDEREAWVSCQFQNKEITGNWQVAMRFVVCLLIVKDMAGYLVLFMFRSLLWL